MGGGVWGTVERTQGVECDMVGDVGCGVRVHRNDIDEVHQDKAGYQ